MSIWRWFIWPAKTLAGVLELRSGCGSVGLGYAVSDQTAGNILRRHGIAPVPERSQTTVKVLTWRGLVLC
jgi:hypothetical protein